MTTTTLDAIAPARLTIPEACRALRVSKPYLYQKINAGLIRAQRDGARRYITPAEIARYVAQCDAQSLPTA